MSSMRRYIHTHRAIAQEKCGCGLKELQIQRSRPVVLSMNTINII